MSVLFDEWSIPYIAGCLTTMALPSGFGAEGQWAERGSFDLMCQAFSGALISQGGGPSHNPVKVNWAAADQVRTTPTCKQRR